MVTDEEARSAASEILSAQDFTRWYTDYEAWLAMLERIFAMVPDWLIEATSTLGEAVDAIFDWIAFFFGLFGVFGESSDAIGWISVGIVAVALFVLGQRWRSRASSLSQSDLPSHDAGRDHSEALKKARDLAREGHYLEAAHRIELATLALLIESDWLELARSEPNRTLRERVRASALPGRDAGRLIELVDRLETLLFDEPRDDRGLFEDWLDLDERIATVAKGRAA